MTDINSETVGLGGTSTQRKERDWTGTLFGNYRIVRALGRGGMGEVLLGEDVRLHRKVAIKILPAGYTTDIERVRRFTQEARTVSALSHPHIVAIYDIGEAEAGKYIVMEYVEGRTLREVSRTSVEIPRVVEWAEQTARALAAAHAAGIVHRDIKPENLMVRQDGYVKVLDFGLARLSRRDQDLSTADTVVDTSEGQLLGTMRYMSPEQGKAETITTATDIFSLGIVIYEVATRTHPFVAQAQVSVLHAIIAQEPIAPSRLNPSIPRWLEALILRMLSKNPTARPTAEEVVQELASNTHSNGATIFAERPGSGTRVLVGREAERKALRIALDTAQREAGALICVVSDAGMGKTALVEEFLAELAQDPQQWLIGRGRCSERLAGAEAYLPFIEALETLLRQDSGGSAARAMKLLAPTWYRQAARQTGDAEAERAQSQERMKREMVAFLQEVSQQQPLVLSFDDLHWADASTIDLLSYIGRHFRLPAPNSIRLAMVVTYRPTEMQLARHPFQAVKLDLSGRGLCRELMLGYLSASDIERYLQLMFPNHSFPAEFARLIHARTEGNALFMTDLIQYLKDRRVIQKTDEGWSVVGSLSKDIEKDLPESVRSMVQRKIDQLEEEDRKLLVTASIQGFEFDSASISAVSKADAADVEEQLERLERVHSFIRLIEERELPDRTFTVRYRFVHVLYHNAFYASLRPTRRAQLSLAMAEALLGFYKGHSSEIASNLAYLFEIGRDFSRAADQFVIAARNAIQVFASKEAAALAQRGLDLLQTLPASAERNQSELNGQMILAMASMSIRGFSAPEVEAAYSRAYELCQHMPYSDAVFQALYGLRAVYVIRADYQKGIEMAERLLQIATQLGDQRLLLQTLYSHGFTKVFVGDFVGACEVEEKAIPLTSFDQKANVARFVVDPKSIGLAVMAWAKWALGFPETARDFMNQSLERVMLLKHPLSTACVLNWKSTLERDIGDFEQSMRFAELTTAHSTEHGLVSTFAWGMGSHGSLLSRMGNHEKGLEELQAAVKSMRAIGSHLAMSGYLIDIADCLCELGRFVEAFEFVAEARAFVERTGELYRSPDIDRVHAKLLLRLPQPRVEEGEQRLLAAIERARSLQARSFELRAALDLASLRRKQGRLDEARDVLKPVYDSFTQGMNTRYIRQAQELLQSL